MEEKPFYMQRDLGLAGVSPAPKSRSGRKRKAKSVNNYSLFGGDFKPRSEKQKYLDSKYSLARKKLQAEHWEFEKEKWGGRWKAFRGLIDWLKELLSGKKVEPSVYGTEEEGIFGG